ncbi:HNH endonuclease [Emticicia fontis]
MNKYGIPVWQMVKEAIETLGGEVKNREIINFITKKWKGIKYGTIQAHINSLTVNIDSRVNYEENSFPRRTDSHSNYDVLYKIRHGVVTKYNFIYHGLWEIYKNEQGSLKVRKIPISLINKIYTPADILWIKNITNDVVGEAYLDVPVADGTFNLEFPAKHKSNVLSPQIGELIVLRQKIDNISVLTHLVTPVDNEIVDNPRNPRFRYSRKVKIIAVAEKESAINVSLTVWKNINFSGISNGNACNINNIESVTNIEELQLQTWQDFIRYFRSEERKSVEITTSVVSELKAFDIDYKVNEGGLKLLSHLVRERNPEIIRKKKRQAIENNSLHCEVCTFSFPQTYNKVYIECHHLTPISSSVGVRETSLDDLALVCANCHRMLHSKFDGQYLSLDELRNIMKK